MYDFDGDTQDAEFDMVGHLALWDGNNTPRVIKGKPRKEREHYRVSEFVKAIAYWGIDKLRPESAHNLWMQFGSMDPKLLYNKSNALKLTKTGKGRDELDAAYRAWINAEPMDVSYTERWPARYDELDDKLYVIHGYHCPWPRGAKRYRRVLHVSSTGSHYLDLLCQRFMGRLEERKD